jgi:hypothetical protein
MSNNQLVPIDPTDAQKFREMTPFSSMIVEMRLLRPAEYNPREIDEQQLRALKSSIAKDKEFLMARPVMVNIYEGREGVIVGGNQRYRAASELGWKTIPVVFVCIDQSKEKAWNMKDNKFNGVWDQKKLQGVLLDLRDNSFDLDSLGFAPDELTNMMTPFAPIDPKNEADNAGSTPSSTWVECPDCCHQFQVNKDVKIVKPTTSAS